ncbi:outer membrane beta-barrel protein [Emcibacter sp. SYSU 3D8]|uniref:outer membrane beta-barrel protein n=1 Tax=Emcibacter sp. SYSU 3D8 TaxID=3133969 RepID=UPI0031FEF0D6
MTILSAGVVAPTGAVAVEFGKAVIDETVQGRVHRGYEAIGIRAGSFMFYPALDVRGEYNDNIYATRGAKVDDVIAIVKPQITGRSLWQRHSLTMTAYGDFGIYTSNSSENYEDAGVTTEGRIDIAEHSQLTARLAAQRDHERRDSPDDARGINPTIYYRLSPELRFEQRVNRMAFRIKSTLDYLDFNDVESSTGVIIDEDDRDRLTWTLEGRAGYDVSENVQVYVSGLMDRRTYDEAFDDNGFQRNSKGFGVFGGVIVEITGTISAEGYVGYRSQSFKDMALVDIDGVAGGLNFIWAPTKLTTVTISGERTVEETTLVGSTASLNTSFGLTVDHELRRNLVITLSGGYLNRHYEGIARDDDNWRGGLGMQYLISRHFRLRAGYNYNSRRSNVFGNGYDTNTAYVNLHVDY